MQCNYDCFACQYQDCIQDDVLTYSERLESAEREKRICSYLSDLESDNRKRSRSARQRRYYLKHRDQKREYNKRYNESHKTEKKAYNQAYYAAHRDEILETGKAYKKQKKKAEEGRCSQAATTV